jgi:rhodanese-related sulfurtransferase
MDDLYNQLESLRSEGAAIIDVRTADEFAEAHIEGAINLPHSEINQDSATMLKEFSKICVFCHMGGRASVAEQILNSLGIQKVECINEDGMAAWIGKGYPVVP